MRWRTSARVYAPTMAYDGSVPPIDVEQSLDNLKLERDAIVLYDALATIEKDPRRADAFRRIAGNERRHAEIWASKLRELGAERHLEVEIDRADRHLHRGRAARASRTWICAPVSLFKSIAFHLTA